MYEPITYATAVVLRSVAGALNFVTTTAVHPVWFPYQIASTLHAARISMVYQAKARGGGAKLNWSSYLAGYLVMCWGGAFISHFLVNLPPPMLYSFHPYINYLSVHFVLTALFAAFPFLLDTRILDTLFFPIDAIIRTTAITSTLSLLANPSTNPNLTVSPLAHLIFGAIASAGGGISAATLNTWSPTWSFSTPVFLRDGAGVMGTLDVWAGALVAFIYSTQTQHPAFSAFVTAESAALPPLSPLGANALGATALMVLFGVRVWVGCWAGETAGKEKKIGGKPRSANGKGKTKVQ